MIDSLEAIGKECKELTLAQKNSDEISSLTSALLLMGGLEIIALVALYIKEGYSSRILVFLSVLLVMFIFYKIVLSKANKVVAAFDLGKTGNTDRSELRERLSYLNAGMDVKRARIKAVTWFYIVVFPIFLLTVKRLFSAEEAASFSYWYLPLLFFISYAVWKCFFDEDVSQVTVVQNRVNYLIKATQLTTKN